MSTRYSVPFDVPSWTYDQALHELHDALMFGCDPLLETVEDMLSELGDPDLSFESIQIAGTNGKTSTSRYTAAILRGEGFRTALYTSPELVRYNERMEVDGIPVSDEQFAFGIAAALTAGKRVNARRCEQGLAPYALTEFDLLTAAACVAFACASVEIAVFEVGMGGRWDATTAVKSTRTVAVTGIGLDHMRILGDTPELIAAEKAAIIRPSMRCVLGSGVATPESVEDVFLTRCNEVEVVPTLVRPLTRQDAASTMAPGNMRTHDDLPHAWYGIAQRPGATGATLHVQVRTPRAHYQHIEALKPAYQTANIALAVSLAEEHLQRPLELTSLRASVASCPTPGRFDVLRTRPALIIDACHNPQSVEVMLGAVREVFPKRAERPTLLAAVLADKDVDGIVALLAPEFCRICVTQTKSPRALPAPVLADAFRAAGTDVADVYSGVEEALEALASEPVLACGTITLAGEVAGLVA